MKNLAIGNRWQKSGESQEGKQSAGTHHSLRETLLQVLYMPTVLLSAGHTAFTRNQMHNLIVYLYAKRSALYNRSAAVRVHRALSSWIGQVGMSSPLVFLAGPVIVLFRNSGRSISFDPWQLGPAWLTLECRCRQYL